MTEAEKEAIKRWNSKNMRPISCRVRTEYAELFRAYCQKHGETVHTHLSRTIRGCAASMLPLSERDSLPHNDGNVRLVCAEVLNPDYNRILDLSGKLGISEERLMRELLSAGIRNAEAACAGCDSGGNACAGCEKLFA